MNLKLLVGTAIFSLGLVLGFQLNDFYHQRGAKSSIPSRPVNVPADAQWAGGIDGGDWVRCEYLEELSFVCDVYADVTGHRFESQTLYKLDLQEFQPRFYSADNIYFYARIGPQQETD